MPDAVFPHLLEPLEIGPVTLPNRIASTAHQTNLVAAHLPTDDFVAYHEARARGGAGMIVLEAAAVHPSGLLTAKTLSAYLPGSEAALRRVAEAVRPHGTKLLVQLFHGGREQIAVPPRSPVVAASAVPSQRFRVEPRALDPEEIEELIEGYGVSARTCAAAGLDGVELSVAHNYLLASFFDPALNRRQDEWADGRRLLGAVIDRVREHAPGLALGIRVSGDAEVSRPIVQAAAGSVDYVHVTLGDASSVRGAAGIVPPPPIGARAGPRRGGAPAAGATADRHRALRGSRARRPRDPGRPRVGRRDDARADHRPGPAPQARRRAGRRGPALHRMQRVHRPLPRRHPHRLHPEPAHGSRAPDAVPAADDRRTHRDRGRGTRGTRRGRRGDRLRPSRRPLRVLHGDRRATPALSRRPRATRARRDHAAQLRARPAGRSGRPPAGDDRRRGDPGRGRAGPRALGLRGRPVPPADGHVGSAGVARVGRARRRPAGKATSSSPTGAGTRPASTLPRSSPKPAPA